MTQGPVIRKGAAPLAAGRAASASPSSASPAVLDALAQQHAEAVRLANRLERFIRLERRAREASDRRELAYVILNDTAAVVPYRQAALWWRESDAPLGAAGRLEDLSGVAEPARRGTFPAWLVGRLAAFADAHPKMSADASVEAEDIAFDANNPAFQSAEDDAMRREYLPPCGLWVELPLGTLRAGVVFWRESPWKKSEAKLLGMLAHSFADAWRAQPYGQLDWAGEKNVRAAAGRLKRLSRKGFVRAGVLVVLIAAALAPIRQSVLAPAEIASQNAFVVRAPLQGVVDEVVVKPNAAVKKGDLLLRMEARELRGSLQAAEQTLAVAEAELRQAEQQAFFDEESKTMLGVLARRRDQAKSEAAYLARELARTEVRAERDGVAVFSDPQSWIGRPVALGERILEIADPSALRIKADIPAGDAIALQKGAPVKFFLNASPLDPIAGELLQVAYRAAPAADGTLAYRAEIDIVDAPDKAVGMDGSDEAKRANATAGDAEAAHKRSRIGLQGTAKIYGDRTPLILYLLRKPLASLRLALGL